MKNDWNFVLKHTFGEENAYANILVKIGLSFYF
jgi:hypothetical protein